MESVIAIPTPHTLFMSPHLAVLSNFPFSHRAGMVVVDMLWYSEVVVFCCGNFDFVLSSCSISFQATVVANTSNCKSESDSDSANLSPTSLPDKQDQALCYHALCLLPALLLSVRLYRTLISGLCYCFLLENVLQGGSSPLGLLHSLDNDAQPCLGHPPYVFS